MKREKKVISISIDADIINQIDAIAYDTRKTRSAVITTALLSLVEEWKNLEDMEATLNV